MQTIETVIEKKILKKTNDFQKKQFFVFQNKLDLNQEKMDEMDFIIRASKICKYILIKFYHIGTLTFLSS
jgi:hypothetical protein